MTYPDTMDNELFPAGENELHAQGESLFRFAVCRVGNEFAAQDLVQDTFLAAIQSRGRLKDGSCPRAWLFGILRHKIVDYFRQKYREPTILPNGVSPETGGDSVDFTAHSPSRQLEFMEFRQALNLALDKLPLRSARAFQLYEIEGQPGATICTQLQISPANLWVTLHRTRKKLSEELSPWDKGER